MLEDGTEGVKQECSATGKREIFTRKWLTASCIKDG
jgi:hypothetical protein